MSGAVTIAAGVIVAGAIGTLLRVLITDIDADFNRQLIGTLAVNVVGSFVLGVLSATDGNLAVIIGVGALGALTTFSTLISQVECINREASSAKAAGYLAASLVIGVAAALVGVALGT